MIRINDNHQMLYKNKKMKTDWNKNSGKRAEGQNFRILIIRLTLVNKEDKMDLRARFLFQFSLQHKFFTKVGDVLRCILPLSLRIREIVYATVPKMFL